MKRLAAAMALGLTLASASLAASGARGPTLTQVGNARFPARAWVLTLPLPTRLDSNRIRLFENGKPVLASVVPARAAARGQFGVVLVIDASMSMAGGAIEGAMQAARQFVVHRNLNEQLAIVTFNHLSAVTLPFASDATAIARVLADRPTLATGTRIYDGIDRGLDLLQGARIASGSIVVLSDGADTGSRATLASVASRARADHVRIFSVGLRSHAFRPSTLQAVAEAGGGRYAEAGSVEQLSRIYDQLGSQLANEYLIRYRSLAGPAETIRVSIVVDGFAGAAEGEYVTPALPTRVIPPYHPSTTNTFWRSGLAMIAAGVLSALLVSVAAVALLHPRKVTFRARMAEFVSMPAQTERERGSAVLTERVLEGAERSLQRTQWWPRFKEELEIAEIPMPAVQIVVLTAAGTFLALWLVYAVGGLLFAPLTLLLPLIVRAILKRKLERRRALFADQLPDNLQVLASALRAGHSFVGALSVVVEDSPDPSRKELRRAIADEQLGVSLQDALGEVARRMDSRELEQVALVAALQRETGGNTAEVLDRVTETIRERFELRRLVKTLTAQGRMSRWVVSLLPVGLLVAITAINPGYVDPLYTTSIGRALLVLAGILIVSGSLVIRRIVNIKV